MSDIFDKLIEVKEKHSVKNTSAVEDIGNVENFVDEIQKTREEVRNLILGYPSLKNENVGTFLGEIHRKNPEILGYPRIPGYPLTTSLQKARSK